jgi:DNA-binding GntR family transcriptional regulator
MEASAFANVPAPTRRPRRRALTDEVRELIAHEFILSGAVAPGDLLPSEKELSARYGVSRVTLRQSMRSLQDAGLIAVRHGVGSVVLERSRAVTHGLDSLSSLETFAREAGQTIGTDQLEIEELRADAELAARLNVAEGHAVLAVRRVKTLDGQPVGWIADYVPAGVLPFDVVRREFDGSILDVLLAHDDIGVEYEDTNITPVNLPRDVARRLGVKAGVAAMYMDGVTWTDRGTVAEFAETWLLPEHFCFSVRRRRSLSPGTGGAPHPAG